jgi:DNA-binding response OmpR family regulator
MTTKRAKIVIIDDEELLSEIFGSWLENDYDVSVFSDPVVALSAIQRMDRCDVIFCDLMMPKLNGMEIYERLREGEKGLENRIVFISGGAFLPKTIEFLQTVPNYRLDKPFTMGDVSSVIHALLNELA